MEFNTLNEEQLVFIEHLLKRRAFGWIEPDHLVAETLAPYGKKELATLTEDELWDILSSSLFWEFGNVESYEEQYIEHQEGNDHE